MPIYLGVDAGGTKTHALLADEKGQALALGSAGNGRWELVGLEGAYEALNAALTDAFAQAGLSRHDVQASAYGLSGIDWPSDKQLLCTVVDRLGVSGPKECVNDAFVALRAGTANPWGVVIIVGTGTLKAGRNRAGEIARTLGVGPSWCDWGGGDEITASALAAVARAYAGMGPPTSLSEKLAAFANKPDVESLLYATTREGLKLVKATHLVFEAASEGDEVARDILLHAAREIAKGTKWVIRKLRMEDDEFDLVLAGSVIKARETLLIDTLISEVKAFAPGANPVRLTAPPAIGGILLAMDLDGLEPDPAVRDRLIETVSALC